MILSSQWTMQFSASYPDLVRQWALADILIVGYMAITSTILLLNKKFLPTEQVTPGKIALLIDIMIVCGIALVQLLFAAFILFTQFAFAYSGGLHPIVTPYLLIGVISAIALFSGLIKPRIVAIVWQVVLVAVTLLTGNPGSPSEARVLWFVPAIIYLSVTAAAQFRKPKLNTLR